MTEAKTAGRTDSSANGQWTIVWGVLVIALAVRVVFLARPIADMVGTSMPDDAFYYFQIARHVAAGAGSTFDGLDPTNGYHPLWMLLCALMFKVLPGAAAPIYGALAVGALFDVASAYLVFVTTRRLSGSFNASLCAMLIYAVGLHQVLLALDGLETPVVVFTFLLTAYTCLRVWDSPGDGKRLVLLGALWSMVFLSRTDVGAFLLPAVLVVGIRAVRHSGFRWAAMAVAAGAAPVLPWVLWNVATFGSMDQVSGKAYVYWNHRIYMMDHGQSSILPGLVARAKEMTFGVIAHIMRYTPFGKPTALLLPLAFVLGIRYRRKQAATAGLMFLFWLIVVPIIGLVLLHGLYRWMICPHYFAPVAAALLVFIVAGMFTIRAKWVLYVVVGLALANLCVQFNYVKPFSADGGYFPWQREFLLRTREKIDDTFPKGTVIASTDCGIHGYYSPHTVINMDCVVNNACFHAILSGKLLDYLRERGVGAVVINSYHERYILTRLLPRDCLEKKTFPWNHSATYYVVRHGPVDSHR